MNPKHEIVPISDREKKLNDWLKKPGGRLGHITSIDGKQLITLVLDTETGSSFCWETPIEHSTYPSLTHTVPQSHWYERTVWDMFNLTPTGHPRLKPNLLHESYAPDLVPLAHVEVNSLTAERRQYKPMEVTGEGIYEIPVGPIHAGIIEPGHFRFSCMGEVIFNLEIRLGYVHRGVERQMCSVPWRHQRFIAEAAASDSAAANAYANAIAIESLCEEATTARAEYLRSISLEVERLSMHISDLGGLAGDIGFLAISATMSRLRGSALRIGELLTGSRFQRGFICPGGVVSDPASNLMQIQKMTKQLQIELKPVLQFFFNNQVANDRMEGIGRVSPRLAIDFGLVGVAGRASNIDYDVRRHFARGVYRQDEIAIAIETAGDVMALARVRAREIETSLYLIVELIDRLPEGTVRVPLPEKLKSNQIGLGIVEAHRGELLHLIFTDNDGGVKRYAIKDPSVNNWTGLAISARNNLVTDFPLCNKSFGLSYSGHDL
ncbi:MAG: NADH-quinone oxidoreductase subunit C [Candidatus Melainabacteria bacterium]|nr:NADH-quinone oxidoreductase subunit C [Candidatus Melainabacteria bacterium]